MSRSIIRIAITMICLLPLPAIADQVFTETVIINGSSSKLCVGSGCTNGESFSFTEEIKLNGTQNEIVFDDNSTSSFPDRDWMLRANDSQSEYFALRDLTSGGTPFSVEGGAPSNTIYIRSNGSVGIGTSMPIDELHVRSGSAPALRLDQDGSNGLTPQIWRVAGNNLAFSVRDITSNSIPLSIEAGAPAGSIEVESNGYVGIGNHSPEGKLHVTEEGVLLSYFESATNAPVQIRMRSDSQNRRFLATNSADQVQSQLIFRNSQVRIAGPTDSGANLYAIFGPAGLITRGPVCSPGPCDKVFDPAEFDVPTIEDHAAYMWENQHLWAVGPTSPDEPFNLTQKAGGMLHELEVAHIYIEELHNEIAEVKARLAEIEARQ